MMQLPAGLNSGLDNVKGHVYTTFQKLKSKNNRKVPDQKRNKQTKNNVAWIWVKNASVFCIVGTSISEIYLKSKNK